MSRILLLLIFLLWLTWTPDQGGTMVMGEGMSLGLFFGGFAAIVLGMGLWSRLLARHILSSNLRRSLNRFNKLMLVARILVPAWFAFGLFGLGWGAAVLKFMEPMKDWPVELPSLLAGTFPPILAWMGLWWSQYPADRALREQSLLIQLDADLPVHAGPGFWGYFNTNLRLQLLFNLVPILLILLIRDLIALGLHRIGGQISPLLELPISLGAALSILILSPEILRRVLETQRLPDSPLRQRLDGLCKRHGLRYRDILLWRTHDTMGNAAVMGIWPRMRYMLLSDLLMETMTDEQIEAVFAHEMGHLVHRHLMWLVASVAIFMMATAGPGTWITMQMEKLPLPSWFPMSLLLLGVGLAAFIAAFGFISRHFERQADVFAARTMQPRDFTINPGRTHVGPEGASLFASALERVAVINNIPPETREWLHGSIAGRMRYLQQLGTDHNLTWQFDRVMRRIYAALVLALIVFGIWAGINIWQEAHATEPGNGNASDAAMVRPGE